MNILLDSAIRLLKIARSMSDDDLPGVLFPEDEEEEVPEDLDGPGGANHLPPMWDGPGKTPKSHNTRQGPTRSKVEVPPRMRNLKLIDTIKMPPS